MKKILIFAFLTIVALQAKAYAVTYDFSYSYNNPYDAASQTYIASTSNAALYTEGPVRLWKPITGGTTFANTTPGVITYHFDFGTDVVGAANLFVNMPTFHWSYSRGHNFLFGSTDGSTWQELMEVTPPAFGSANGGVYSGALPSWMLGESHIWLRADLYSYGQYAPFGSVYTNTSQLNRHDVNLNNKSFGLDVNFLEDNPPTGGGNEIPEPSTLIVLGLGLTAFAVRKKFLNA